MESLRVTFGKRVRALREARGWSQERLGKAAGLGGKYIGIIERGEKSASFDAIEKLAQALHAECFEFFVPMNRRTDALQRQIRMLTADAGRIEIANVETFLSALGFALRKLERQPKLR